MLVGSTMHMYLIDENSTIAPSIMPSIKKRLILPRATQSRKTIVHKRLPPRVNFLFMREHKLLFSAIINNF